MAKARTFDVGSAKITVISSHPIGDSEATSMSGTLKAVALEGTRLAVAAGNAAALSEAIAIVRSTDDQVWPDWLVTAMADAVTAPVQPTGRGRTANPRAARRARLIEGARGEFVDRMLANGLSKRKAFQRASECLGGDAAGSPNVMEQSYNRFAKRVRVSPHDYFPLVCWPFVVPNKST